MKIETIKIPDVVGVYVMVGGAKFHLTIQDGQLSVRCSDGGAAGSGDRIFTHMPAGNKVIIEVH